MEDNRSLRIDALLDAALKMPSGDAEHFLRVQCGSDDSMLREALDQFKEASNEALSDFVKPLSPILAAEVLDELMEMIPREIGCPMMFADYELLHKLGQGAFGVVFKARHIKLNRIVALKRLLIGERAGPAEVRRFRAEAEAVAKLDHPGIVPIFEVGQHQQQHYFSMGFVEGRSLAAEVAVGPLPPREAARLVQEVAQAVQYAHDKGVVHRDLKPANILLDAKRKPRVTDFGLAKFTKSQSDRTGAGQILGTPNYMPPEQAMGRIDQVGPASDVYSLGAVLYCLLTGRPPFQSADVLDTLTQVRHKEPIHVRQLNSQVPRDLETITHKCLEKTISRRYGTASELELDLLRYLSGEPIQARPVGPVERLLKWAKRRPAAASLTVVGMISLILTGAVWVAIRDNDTLMRANAAVEQVNVKLANANRDLDESLSATETERSRAVIAREEADQLKLVAEEQRGERYRYQYLSSLALADQYWRDGRQFEIGARLDEVLPPPDEADRRGFEWHYWKKVTGDLRRIEAHDGTIQALALDSKGGLIATGGRDQLIRLWDLATGMPIRTLEKHRLPIAGLAFSPDGESLVSVASNNERPDLGGEFRIWDVRSGTRRFAKSLPGSPLFAVAFDPKGSRFVVGGATRAARGITGVAYVWDLASERQEAAVDAALLHKQLVNCLAFSPDGLLLATGTSPNEKDPGKVLLWNTSEWKFARTIGAHRAGIWSVTFAPEGKQLITTGIDNVVRIWDVDGGNEVRKLEGHNHSVSRASVSPDGRKLATGGFDGTVSLWDLDSGRQLVALKGHSGFIYGVAFSGEGKQLVTVGNDGILRFWDGTIGKRYYVDLPSQKAEFTKVIFSPDGRFLAWASGSKSGKGQLGVWDLVEGKSHFLHNLHDAAYSAIAFNPQGTSLAIATARSDKIAGKVEIWDLASRERVRMLDGKTGLLVRLSFAADGQQLVGAEQSGSIMTWDMATGHRQVLPRLHRQPLFALALSSDGKLVASGSASYELKGGALKMWDLERAKEEPSFDNAVRGVFDLTFSPDGSHLAVANEDETVRVWNIRKKSTALTLSLPRQALAIAYSHDGRRLAAGGFNGIVTLWDVETGYRLLSLNAADTPIDSIALSPDGLQLAISTARGEVRVLNASPLNGVAIR